MPGKSIGGISNTVRRAVFASALLLGACASVEFDYLTKESDTTGWRRMKANMGRLLPIRRQL
jgi:hypothetical protein